MSFEVELVCDSISPVGRRLTTFSLKYPRFIHAELMTHRVFSRNASSSRAIPVKKIIRQVVDNPAMPVYWGKNQKGMQAGAELSDVDRAKAQAVWLAARDEAVKHAEMLVDLGIHKQIANRVLEPWHHINVVVTATEYGNWFNLRCHPDAQPEIQELANQMMRLYYKPPHKPVHLNYGDWHLPFITPDDRQHGLSDLQLRQISTARCARVSYMKHDGSIAEHLEDIRLHDSLITSGHMSPTEHQATPLPNPNEYVGNFRGWVQYRKTLQGENRSRYTPPKDIV